MNFDLNELYDLNESLGFDMALCGKIFHIAEKMINFIGIKFLFVRFLVIFQHRLQ